MQFNWTIISDKIYGILKGSCKTMSMYDAKGNETIDPDEATRFFASFESSNPKLDDFTVLVAIHDEGQYSHVDIKTPELDDDKDFEKVNAIRNGIRKGVGEREGIKINWQVMDHAIDPREEAVHNIKEAMEISESKYPMLDKYKKKEISGLYAYIHYENPEDGTWIQIPSNGAREFIYRDTKHKLHKYFDKDGLMRAIDDDHKPDQKQISELSKGKLKKYVKKASADMNDNAFFAGSSSERRDPKSLEYDKKAQNRLKGIDKATDKLEELSKKTLKSYAKKATDDLRHNEFFAGEKGALGQDDYADEHTERANKRKAGINKAIDKLEEEIRALAESKDISNVYGSTKSSFQKIGNAKLIIRHSNSVNEEKHGARSRNIKALLIENKYGERFAYPHLHVTGARAFARHISNGGTNHDAVATKLFTISENYLRLRRSGSALRLTEGADATWVPAIRESMNKINRQLKSMHGPKGYQAALTNLLQETLVEDTSMINELYSSILEACGIDQDSDKAKDFEVAARYIAERRLDPKPVNFSWNSKPDLTKKLSEFVKVSERLNWQLNELAAACTDQAAMSKLASIAEMISKGVMPNADDMGVIKQAFESHQSYIHEDADLPEERELNEFLDDFTIESTFAEDQEIDEASRIVQKFSDPSGRAAVVRKDADWNEFIVQFFTDGVHQKDADYHTDDKNDAVGTAELFISGQRSLMPAQVKNDAVAGLEETPKVNFDDFEDADYEDGQMDRDVDPYDGDRDSRDFASHGSALHAATSSNPRTLPCPTCNHPNRLTPKDKLAGYQCDRCADAAESGGEIDYLDVDDDEEDSQSTTPSAGHINFGKLDMYENGTDNIRRLIRAIIEDDEGVAADAETDAFGMNESPDGQQSNTKVVNGITIRTNHEYPPIPIRAFDWSAVTDNYDGSPDARGNDSIVGHGKTEEDAIADLMSQLEDLDEASNDQDIQMDVHNAQSTSVADAETNGNQFSESEESESDADELDGESEVSEPESLEESINQIKRLSGI